MATTAFEYVKGGFARFVSTAAEYCNPTSCTYLATGPVAIHSKTEKVLRDCLDRLKTSQKHQVYGKVWELAKMHNPSIEGADWGEAHAFEDSDRLSKALHRLGFLEPDNLHVINCLPFEFGEGGIGSQYYSLSEKIGKDPTGGFIGYVNGMGSISLGHAGADASHFSNQFTKGCNLHCIYNSTHQKTSQGDIPGFLADILRLQAVNGGSYTKTSYLIAQQWIDFLDANPGKKFLQVGVSEGAAHVNAALRMTSQARPELISRIRVLNFCPAYFIFPSDYPGLQVINLVKIEDDVINPWGTNTDMIGYSSSIKIVPHTYDHPHHHNNHDFSEIAIPYIDNFKESGDLYWTNPEPLSQLESIKMGN